MALLACSQIESEMGVGEATHAGRHLWQGSDEVNTNNIKFTYVGELSKRKGVDLLISELKSLKLCTRKQFHQ